MEKMAVVLDGYESVEVVPSLFVLMGNFCSHPCNLSFHSFSSLRLVHYYLICRFITLKIIIPSGLRITTS